MKTDEEEYKKKDRKRLVLPISHYDWCNENVNVCDFEFCI